MLGEALGTFISVENERDLVTMSQRVQFNEVHKIVPPNFNKAMFKDAEVVEGGEVLTLRPNEERTPTLLVYTSTGKKNEDHP